MNKYIPLPIRIVLDQTLENHMDTHRCPIEAYCQVLYAPTEGRVGESRKVGCLCSIPPVLLAFPIQRGSSRWMLLVVLPEVVYQGGPAYYP